MRNLRHTEREETKAMKKLTRMKLINWHRFNNCTIEFGDSTLLSGENGAGKSTLLDAIQFVIICSTGYFLTAKLFVWFLILQTGGDEFLFPIYCQIQRTLFQNRTLANTHQIIQKNTQYQRAAITVLNFSWQE